MTLLTWPFKDPDEILDYGLTWIARLGTDTIASSAWIIVAGNVTVSSDTHDDTTTTVWLSGGLLDEVCELTNRIVTAGGRTMDQSVKLRIKRK